MRTFKRTLCSLATLLLVAAPLSAQTIVDAGEGAISSMSIVGFDPDTREVGVAMASRFFAVAPIAVHVRAEVGAIATMGGSPYKDADEMMDWLEGGASPQEVIDRLHQRYGDSWGGGQINKIGRAHV